MLCVAIGGVSARRATGQRSQLDEATIASIHEAIRAKQLTTSSSWCGMYLARIKAYNGTCVSQPQGLLGPVTTIPNARPDQRAVDVESAAAYAQGIGLRCAQGAQHDGREGCGGRRCPMRWKLRPTLDRKFAATGKLVGPLHGIPISIKDQYDTFDMRTTSGADAPYANDRPPDDSTFVAKLARSGRDHSGEGQHG